MEKKIKRAVEVLEEIGQEDEKAGIQATQYFMDQWDRAQWEQNQIAQDTLQKSTKYSKIEYYRKVAQMLYEEAKDLDIPVGYQWNVKVDDRGVAFFLIDSWKRKYNRAFKPCGVPKYDFAALTQILVDADTTVQNIENERRKRLQHMGVVV